MLYLISINLFTGIIFLLLGYKIGTIGGHSIINKILLINLSYLSYYLYYIIYKGQIRSIYITNWSNDIIKNIRMNIIIDKISIIMSILIIIIGYIIIKYSNWYIPELKFISFLYFFIVSMLILICAKEITSLYIGWEWVGICSYILINYWNRNNKNNKGGIKAILYNKIGDIGILILIIYTYMYYNSTDITVYSYNINIGTIKILISIGIAIASIAKSSQYLFHPWLGDAMAGPTPVSALLHAATMVTAGIILIYRTAPYIYGEYIAIITILFGGISSLFQNDIKKVIAFSTCSQLGYMYLISIYNNIPINFSFFHLYTHAFFKALLFLCAGILIHYASNEQDLRKLHLSSYSFLYPLLLFSSMSLLSFPFSSGFYSKDSILISIQAPYLYYMSIFGAIITILYSYKLIYNIFIRTALNRYSISSFPLSLYLSLLPLLFGSIFLGSISYPFFISLFSYILVHNVYINVLPILGLFIIGIIIKYKGQYSISVILYKIYILLNNKTYIDSIINNISYTITNKSSSLFNDLDKGILEYIGPIGIYKSLVNNNIYKMSTYTKVNLINTFSFFVIFMTILFL